MLTRRAESGFRPVVVGYDAVSPLGTVLDDQWNRAAAGESGLGPLTRFPLRERFPVQVAGQVPEFDASPYPFLSPRKMAHWSSPIFKHAMLVAHRALAKAGVEIAPDIAPRTAVTFSTAVGGLDAVLAADRLMVERNRLPHPFVPPNSCVNMVGGKISILTGAQGPILSTVTACATGNTSMIVGAMLLARGDADIAICGAVDFPLMEPIVGGFATMNGAYKSKPEEQSPAAASRPFSHHRKGFVVSEGAACVVLTTPEFARAHGLTATIELAGWASTSDAHHFVAPNPDTVERCMAMAVGQAGIAPADIDSVNAHAASTKVGDMVEAQTMMRLFGGDLPPTTANKSLFGHCMGASSAVESVLAMEGMVRSVLLPTRNYVPDPEFPLDCLTSHAVSLEQEFVLKNAFGFGGCNACIVFRRLESAPRSNTEIL